MNNTLLGSQLHPQDRAEVLRSYAHRYTGNHCPDWARTLRPDGSRYPVQFRDDADWLANTRFAVTRAGRLDKRARFCRSFPTWPNGRG